MRRLNCQIAKELELDLELDLDSVNEMATLLRNGTSANEPEVTLSGEVECLQRFGVSRVLRS